MSLTEKASMKKKDGGEGVVVSACVWRRRFAWWAELARKRGSGLEEFGRGIEGSSQEVVCGVRLCRQSLRDLAYLRALTRGEGRDLAVHPHGPHDTQQCRKCGVWWNTGVGRGGRIMVLSELQSF